MYNEDTEVDHLLRKITISRRGGEFKVAVLIKMEIFITKENRPASTEILEKNFYCVNTNNLWVSGKCISELNNL